MSPGIGLMKRRIEHEKIQEIAKRSLLIHHTAPRHGRYMEVGDEVLLPGPYYPPYASYDSATWGNPSGICS